MKIKEITNISSFIAAKRAAVFLLLFSLFFATNLSAQLCNTDFNSYKSGKDVLFKNNSTNLPGLASYGWWFGDNTPVVYDSHPFVEHKYTLTGTYLVCLRDTNCFTNGLFCDSVTVTSVKNLTAKFSYFDGGNGAFIFTDSSVAANLSNFTSSWDFGDGYIGDGKLVKHNYDYSGTYVVTLTIIDSNDNYGIYRDTLVADVPSPCVANFYSTLINNTYVFNADCLTSDTVVNFKWDFGDGGSFVFGRDVIHRYTEPGRYYVTLYMNGILCNDSITKEVVQPDSTCDFNFTTEITNQRVKFSINSKFENLPFSDYATDFGLGLYEKVNKKFSYIYSDTGSYYVCLYSLFNLCGVENMAFCDTVTISTISPICVADFETYPKDLSIMLQNTSIVYGSSAPSGVFINWGDGYVYGNNYDSGYFNHTYLNEGTYNIQLIVNNGNSCADTITKLVSVGPEYLLGGYVYKGNVPSDFSMVNIYSFDTTSGLMYYNNTAFTDNSGRYDIYLKRGFYLVQADFAFDPFTTGIYLPTYYKNKLNWDLANVIFLGNNRDSININLIPYTLDTTGAGNITGMVKYGNGVNNQNGPIEPGTPAAKMLIYLIDGKNNIITYTHTHDDGSFLFKKVPAGNYKVWGEMAGKQTIPALVNLKNSNSVVNGVQIVIGKNQLTTNVEDYKNISQADFNVFPNPVSNEFTVTWESSKTNPSSCELYNMEGRLVDSKAINAMDDKVSFDMDLQHSGLYLVRINLSDGNSVTKKIMKTN